MSLRCRLGWHHWLFIASGSLSSVRACRRCKRRQVFWLGGVWETIPEPLDAREG